MSTRLPMLPVIIVSIGILPTSPSSPAWCANIISQFGEDLWAASKVMGAPVPWILLKHVARNCIAPIMVFATVLVGPTRSSSRPRCPSSVRASVRQHPDLGQHISEGKELLLWGHWWPTFFPACSSSSPPCASTVLSEGLTDAMASPRIKAKPDVQADEESHEAQETERLGRRR